MKLLVDMGNTRTKAVLSDNGELLPIDFSLALFNQYDISQLTYASVRHNERAMKMLEIAHAQKIQVTQVETSAQAFGVKCAYDNYQTLGIDRWLAVLGAVNEHPNQDLIVIDAGTATTVDFVTADKAHIGGWIIPGLELMTTSVTSQTDKVFSDLNTNYSYGIGKATPEALKYGCLAAQLGIVRQAVEYFVNDAKVIIAGGVAPLMLNPLSDLKPYHDDLIVFKGLDLY